MADTTDTQVREWAQRHGLDGRSLTDLRCAFDDAQTIDQPNGGAGADELRAALAKSVEIAKDMCARVDLITKDRDDQGVRHFNEMVELRRDRDNWRDRATINGAGAEDARDAARWRHARDNGGNGVRVITWDASKRHGEDDVMFPSPQLADAITDAAMSDQNKGKG